MSYVELSSVRKRFGETEIIHGIDLGIEKEEFTVFVGPSGCGKSTLLRMIAGLEDLQDGSIHISGTRSQPSAALPWCSRTTRSTRT